MTEDKDKSRDATPPDAEPDSREKILDAALEEFAEFGRAGSRVDRIAHRAGLNKAMLYYHFGSKDDLFTAVIDRRFNRLLPMVSKSIDESTDLEGALKALAQMYAVAFGQEPSFVRILHREMADPDGVMAQRITELFLASGLPQRVTGLLSEYQTLGLLRELEVKQMVVSFVTMNIGYYIMRPVLNRILDIADQEAFVAERKRAVVDIFLYGVLNR